MSDIEQQAIDFLKKWEGCRLTSYQDQGGRWTIGFGACGSNIGPNLTWTQAQAEYELGVRVSAIYNALCRHIIPPLDTNQYVALISLAYNIGITALFGSSLFKYLNSRDNQTAAREFPKWNHVAGRPSQGLLNRRLAEQKLFLS